MNKFSKGLELPANLMEGAKSHGNPGDVYPLSSECLFLPASGKFFSSMQAFKEGERDPVFDLFGEYSPDPVETGKYRRGCAAPFGRALHRMDR